MEHTTIAVDLAKSVFQVAVSHRAGHVDEERRLSRSRFLTYFAQRPPATILLEACGSAHHWARQLQPFGHTVRLLPAHDVHRYVRRNKTDRTDTRALLEAGRNDEIRAVPVKTVDQQAIASLHRLRSTWLAARTSRLNTVRGLLREFGVAIPVGAAHVVPQVRALFGESAPPVPILLQATLADVCEEIATLEANMQRIERQLEALARQMPDVALLQTVRHRRDHRHRAHRVGRRHPAVSVRPALRLTPKEDSSALRRRLGAISKQGDVYLRMLVIHGARSVLWHAKAAAQPTALQR